MSHIVFCDRCKVEIKFYDQRMTDLLEKEYPRRSICSNCDLEIMLAGVVAKRDSELNLKPGTSLKLMLEKYNNPEKRAKHGKKDTGET